MIFLVENIEKIAAFVVVMVEGVPPTVHAFVVVVHHPVVTRAVKLVTRVK